MRLLAGKGCWRPATLMLRRPQARHPLDARHIEHQGPRHWARGRHKARAPEPAEGKGRVGCCAKAGTEHGAPPQPQAAAGGPQRAAGQEATEQGAAVEQAAQGCIMGGAPRAGRDIPSAQSSKPLEQQATGQATSRVVTAGRDRFPLPRAASRQPHASCSSSGAVCVTPQSKAHASWWRCAARRDSKRSTA